MNYKWFYEIIDKTHKTQKAIRAIAVYASSESEAIRKVKRLKPKAIQYPDSQRIVKARHLVEVCTHVEEI